MMLARGGNTRYRPIGVKVTGAPAAGGLSDPTDKLGEPLPPGAPVLPGGVNPATMTLSITNSAFWKGYRIFVAVTAALHLATGVFIAARFDKDWPVPVYASYVTWAADNPNFGCFVNLPPAANSTVQVVNGCSVRTQWRYVGKMSTLGLVMAFSFLSFAFQIYPALPGWGRRGETVIANGRCNKRSAEMTRWERYVVNVVSGRQPLRWWEYSVSSSLMVLVFLALNGVQDLWLLLAAVAANWSCMMFGLLQEEVLVWSRAARAANPDLHSPVPVLAAHFYGWVPFISVWSIITAQFLWALDSAGNGLPDEGVPKAVYAIVYTQLVLFGCFGLVQAFGAWAHVARRARRQNIPEMHVDVGFGRFVGAGTETPPEVAARAPPPPASADPTDYMPLASRLINRWTYVHSEVTYTVLSLVAKQLLVWLLFFGVIMRNTVPLTPEPPCGAY